MNVRKEDSKGSGNEQKISAIWGHEVSCKLIAMVKS